MTSQYVEARAHGEGANGNQALFRVYDRMTNQARTAAAKSGDALA
jgi:2-hydroxy-3-oxopropionate reductase